MGALAVLTNQLNNNTIMTRDTLRFWRMLLGVLSLLAIAMPTTVVVAQEDEEDEDEPKTVTVTGSRIKRIDVEGPQPVLRLTREDLQATGFTTVGDALRALPFNSGQALTPADSGTSFTPGVSTFNLRGLGNNNVLVLVNGRRAAPFGAPGFNGLQTVFDLNSIPAAAIDSIDILKDGGSALYGSDAVSGVVNVVLRRDFEGLNTTFSIGNNFDTEDAFYRQMSAVMGTSSGKGSIVVAFDWEKRNSVMSRDWDLSDDADNRGDDAEAADARWVVLNSYGAEPLTEEEIENSVSDLFGVVLGPAAQDGLWDRRSSRGYPGYVTTSEGRFTFPEPTANPTREGAVPGVNLYNYAELTNLFPEFQRYSFYTRGVYDITDTIQVYGEFSLSRAESLGWAAPTPVDIEGENGLTPNEPMYMPAFNPFNPFGEDIFNGRRRLLEPGFRYNDVTSESPRIVLGAAGEIGFSWTWDAGFVYSKGDFYNTNEGAVPDYRLQQALLGLTRLGNGTLEWNPNTPIEDRVYFNWFGPSEEGFGEFLAVDNPQMASVEIHQWDASATGDIFELPAGMVGAAFGIEHREEDFMNIRTDLNQQQDILGGSAGSSARGTRDTMSLYAEVAIPVHEMFEVQVAGRYEDYSDDGFDDEVRPKIAGVLRPTSWLLIRASYSESFKAPDLAFLYTASQTSFTSFQFVDPVTNEEIDQIQIVTAGNPDLEPELTDTYYAGITFEPGNDLFNGLLDGFSATIEYYQFDQENLLAQLSDFFGFEEFFTGAAAGDPLFAGKVVRDPQTNQVLFVRDDYVNLSTLVYEGFDFILSYSYEHEDWGNFRAQWYATYLDKLEIDGGDIAGSFLRPEWRHELRFAWTRGDWAASVYTTIIDERERTFFWDITQGQDIGLRWTHKRQFVVNPQVSYAGLWDTRITLGITNLFDDHPSDPIEAVGTTPGVNIIAPRSWFLRVEKEF